jgi:redox-sensitive bicupin YhaK (pirin superfamily)
MHEEMPELGEESLVGFQLWVNLPASLKMMQPRYQDIPASLVPEIERDDGVTIRVIAGEVDGVVGPVSDIAAQPAYLDVRLSAGSKTDLPVQAGQSAFAYVFEGEGMFGAGASATDVPGPKMVVFGDGDRVEATAGQAGARFLLVAGQPLHEPIARYGPFVMNTREEIEQALRDLREGTFIREQPASEPDQWYGLRA